MAPIMKGMKRKSEAAPGSADRSVAQKVGSVTKVLGDSQLPKSVVSLLKGMAGKSLSVVKDTRHAHQSAVVAMIAEALDEIHASKKASVAEAQTKSASTTQEKASRIEAMDKATATLAASVAVETEKEAAAKACTAATAEKKGALKTAQKAQQAGDADLVELDKQKALLHSAKLTLLGSFVGKGALSSVLKVAKTYGVDRGLMDAMPKAFSTEPAKRTEFDRMVIEKVIAALAKAESDLQAQIDAQAPGRAERAAAVEAAKHALEEAKAAEKTAKAAVEAAEEAVGEAKKAMGAAKKSVSNFLPDMKRLMDGYDELKASLTAFDATRATFAELKELMPPPPEPEPVVEVEAAEEPVAVEATPAKEAPAAAPLG